MLELRHLRTLTALAETGSVSLAAKRVHLTQSAVSHQLASLKSYYGMEVVRRCGQSIELTEAGRRLIALAGAILEQVQAAERDLAQLADKDAGSLRIALECHTCFDWLMPIMDIFRKRWPRVELDLVSGFHSDPIDLLVSGEADVVVGSERTPRRDIVYHPLFRFEIQGVLPVDHPLGRKRVLQAKDFADQTLITYPVPEERIDVIRRVLKPAGVQPTRRTAELTVAILQLVASSRGVAALPNWGIKNYLDYNYVIARRIGNRGLWSDLYAATTSALAERPYLRDFLATTRDTCFSRLSGIVPLE
ncbi:MAG TPA: LysR family transcriptional regulator [Burkholderiales bacterium]|nr:LysR family transcriptional regulator [Burkholderiales bacterium]